MSAITMMQNFARIYGPLQTAVFSFALLAGAIMGLVSLMKLRQANNTGQSPLPAFLFMVGGSFFFSFDWWMTRATHSFFPGATPLSGLAYTHPSGNPAAVLAQVAVGMIVILGWCAAFRGGYLLFSISNRGEGFASALKFLLGAVFAINFVAFAAGFTTLLGIGTGWESTLGL